MGPLELDGAQMKSQWGPRLRAIGALEQVGPLKQESMGLFGDKGGP